MILHCVSVPHFKIHYYVERHLGYLRNCPHSHSRTRGTLSLPSATQYQKTNTSYQIWHTSTVSKCQGPFMKPMPSQLPASFFRGSLPCPPLISCIKSVAWYDFCGIPWPLIAPKTQTLVLMTWWDILVQVKAILGPHPLSPVHLQQIYLLDHLLLGLLSITVSWWMTHLSWHKCFP